MKTNAELLNCFARMTVAIAVLLFAHATPAGATPPAGGYSLVYSDNFAADTVLDTTHWSDAWLGNYAGGYNTSSAVVLVPSSYLALKAYTSGGVQYAAILGTRYKYQPKYGYIEAGIRWANTPGNWSALWTFADTIGANNLPHTDGVEADIAEHRAVDESGDNIAGVIDHALHWDGYGSTEQSLSLYPAGSGLSTGFHVYGMAWTPTTQTFYIDNVATWTVTDDATDSNPQVPNAAVSQISQYLLLSMIVQGGTWAGNIPTGGYGTLQSTTTEMDIEYVDVYQIGPPTPLAPTNVEAGPNSTGGWNLSWALTDNAPYYHVKRSTTSGGPYTTIATTGMAATNNLGAGSTGGTCYTDTTTVTGTNYYYVVSAVNGSQESPNSLEVGTTAAGTPAAAHTGSWTAEAIFTGAVSYSRIQQTITVSASTNYQFGAWIKGAGRTTMRVYEGTSSTQFPSAELTVSATPSWTYYSFSFNTAGYSQATIRFDDESPLVGAISVDDVFFGIAGGTNLLTNPGFESGSTTGWNTSAAGSVWTIDNCGGSSSGNEYDGYQSARAVFSGTATYDRIVQTINVPASTTYQYGAWIKGGGTTTLRVYQGQSGVEISGAELTVHPTSTWTYYSLSFNTGTNTQISIRLDDESSVAATMYVDDVFMGPAGGANLLVNPNFELGTVGWNTQNGGPVWTIGQW